jgi:hypothetical protein
MNIYAPKNDRDRAKFWDTILNSLLAAASWVLGGDINMVEGQNDQSGNPPKKLLVEE